MTVIYPIPMTQIIFRRVKLIIFRIVEKKLDNQSRDVIIQDHHATPNVASNTGPKNKNAKE